MYEKGVLTFYGALQSCLYVNCIPFDFAFRRHRRHRAHSAHLSFVIASVASTAY